MTNSAKINRIILIITSAIIYFALDFIVRKTGFLNFNSYLGLKNFLPVTLALLFGTYGIIGEVIGCTLSALIIKTTIPFLIMEYICIVLPGFITWFLWHIGSYTHKIHFKWPINFFRYFVIIVVSYVICGFISRWLINPEAFFDIVVWHVSLSILIGIPIDIMYSGLMCLNPILPPIKENGKYIKIIDDIVFTLTNDVVDFGKLNEKIEEFAMGRAIDMKRMLEIQSCIEEFYIRITQHNPDVVIDFRANYDVTFSVEFNYLGKKYNPLFVSKDEDEMDTMGLKLIKHRALLASFNYFYGENNVHVVL